MTDGFAEKTARECKVFKPTVWAISLYWLPFCVIRATRSKHE